MSKRIYSKKSEKLADAAHCAYRAGKEIDLHKARLLEDTLRQKPNDYVTRCELLGYYSKSTDKNAGEYWSRHADWLILNCADEKLMCYVMRTPESVSKEQFEALKENFLWKIDRNSKNSNIAGHGAMFCRERDLELGEKLYKKAKKLAPHDERWSRALCHIHAKEAHSSKDKKVAAVAFKRGLKFVRKFESVPHHPHQIIDVLTTLVTLALELDDLRMAAKLVKEIKHCDFDVVNPSYKHHFAGLLAIKEGRLKRAKTQLLKAAKLGESPHNRSLELARQLQNAGELECVSEYLKIAIKNLSPEIENTEIKLVKKWIKQLEGGNTADLFFPPKRN
jgi:tetratricopeptide (TPR) repeat protein